VTRFVESVICMKSTSGRMHQRGSYASTWIVCINVDRMHQRGSKLIQDQ